MKPVLCAVSVEGGGKVSILLRPRGDEWLADELVRVHEPGVDALISALCAHEADELGLADEAGAADRAGLRFCRIAVPDFSVPRPGLVDGLARSLLRHFADLVRGGGHVAVHCRGSVGRSGMITSHLLTRLGWEPDEAMARMSTVRGREVPETDEQRAWVRRP